MQFDTWHAALAICWLAAAITVTRLLPRVASRHANLQCSLHVRWWKSVDVWGALESLFWSVCLLCLCRNESIRSTGQNISHWARCRCSFCGVSIILSSALCRWCSAKTAESPTQQLQQLPPASISLYNDNIPLTRPNTSNSLDLDFYLDFASNCTHS